MGKPRHCGAARGPHAVVPEALNEDPRFQYGGKTHLYVPQTGFVVQANCPEIF